MTNSFKKDQSRISSPYWLASASSFVGQVALNLHTGQESLVHQLIVKFQPLRPVWALNLDKSESSGRGSPLEEEGVAETSATHPPTSGGWKSKTKESVPSGGSEAESVPDYP